MATIDYLKGDLVINGTATTTVIEALRKANVSDTHILDVVGNWFVGATLAPQPQAFRFVTDVQDHDANCASTYARSFAHADWIDGENRVQAGMTPEELGFNARFHAIENEFDAVAAQLSRLGHCGEEVRADLVGIVKELQAKLTSMQNQIHGLQQARDKGSKELPTFLGTIDDKGTKRLIARFGNEFSMVAVDGLAIDPNAVRFERPSTKYVPMEVSPQRMKKLVNEVDTVMMEPRILELFAAGDSVTVGDIRRDAGEVMLPSGVTLGALLATADASTTFRGAGEVVSGVIAAVVADLPEERVEELRASVLDDRAAGMSGQEILKSDVGVVAGGASLSKVMAEVGVSNVSAIIEERPSVVMEKLAGRGVAVDEGVVHSVITNAVVARALGLR